MEMFKQGLPCNKKELKCCVCSPNRFLFCYILQIGIASVEFTYKAIKARVHTIVNTETPDLGFLLHDLCAPVQFVRKSDSTSS